MSDAGTMDVINNFLATKGIYSLVLILLFLGLYGMIVSNNYMKKMIPPPNKVNQPVAA